MHTCRVRPLAPATAPPSSPTHPHTHLCPHGGDDDVRDGHLAVTLLHQVHKLAQRAAWQGEGRQRIPKAGLSRMAMYCLGVRNAMRHASCRATHLLSGMLGGGGGAACGLVWLACVRRFSKPHTTVALQVSRPRRHEDPSALTRVVHQQAARQRGAVLPVLGEAVGGGEGVGGGHVADHGAVDVGHLWRGVARGGSTKGENKGRVRGARHIPPIVTPWFPPLPLPIPKMGSARRCRYCSPGPARPQHNPSTPPIRRRWPTILPPVQLAWQAPHASVTARSRLPM